MSAMGGKRTLGGAATRAFDDLLRRLTNSICEMQTERRIEATLHQTVFVYGQFINLKARSI